MKALIAIAGVIAAFAALAYAPSASAQVDATCSVPGYPTATHQPSSAACCETLRVRPSQQGGINWDSVSVVNDNGPTGSPATFQCELLWNGQTDMGNGFYHVCTQQEIDDEVCGNLPPSEEECAASQGQRFLASAQDQADSFTPPGEGCFAGCSAYLRANQPWTRLGPPGARDWLAQYEYTGQACTINPTFDEEVDTTQGPEACGVDGPLEYCAGPQMAPGCGFVNDQYTCLGVAADQNECFEGNDGAMICAEGTPTPPAPDNGTPGQPATPDGVVTQTTNNVTTTFNYFGGGTVGGSARPPGGEAIPGGGDVDGDGKCDGSDCGNTDDEEEDDSGTLPGIGEEGDCVSFAACTAGFYSRATAAPIVQSVAGVGDALPGGACPSVNISMFGETSSLSEPMCDLWDASIAPFIGVFFLVCYAWLSTRIVLSA